MENLPAAPVLYFFHISVETTGGGMENICCAHRDVTRRHETSFGKMHKRDVCVFTEV